MKPKPTVHAVIVNGTRLFITVDGRGFRWIDGAEQCDGCGRDSFSLVLNRAGKPEALVCDVCASAYPLRDN